MEKWPKISLITPSYNQGRFLEETIRSVLDQNYPNLEYFVFDGASTDESVEILRRYEARLTHWESKPDNGQAHAINKGLDRVTGEITGYLNSDDLLLPGSLAHIAKAFYETQFDIFVGRRREEHPTLPLTLRQRIRSLVRPFVHPYFFHRGGAILPQECVFWKAYRYRSLRFSEKYYFCLDIDWFIRIFSGAHVIHSSREVGWFRHHETSKTATAFDVGRKEIKAIADSYSSTTTKIDPSVEKTILSSFRCNRWKALLLKLLGKESYFQYRLPEYWHSSPARRAISFE